MKIKALHDETELLRKTAGGDQRAFKQVYDHYQQKTYQFALSILHDELLAEEVMQSTLLNFGNKAKSY